MYSIIVLYQLFVCCLSCCYNEFMINGSKWTETEIFKQFSIFQTFDYESSYHNFSEIMNELSLISRTHPNTTKLFSLGKTAENRDIPAVILSNKSKNRDIGKLVVFECGIHAREWISVSFCLWSIDQLLNYDSSLLESYQFLIIPVLNPDGYVFSWEQHRLWRKNRDIVGNDCRGVDLNRNWGTQQFCVHSAKNDSCHRTNCGETPFSSPEVKALSQYLLDNKNDIIAYFSIHSYGQLWIYPRGYSNDTIELAQIGVKALYRMYGTEYSHGSFSQISYLASGMSVDWVYDTLNVGIAYTIELRDRGRYGFLLPCYLIKPVCEETWAGIDAVLNHLTLTSNGTRCLSKTVLIIIITLLITVARFKLN